ncbi:hypothetical protein V8B97DRAFT_1877743, partial [Scleroderma yunnanense]
LPDSVDKTNAGTALIRWEPQWTPVLDGRADADVGPGSPLWIDRYDVRLLLDSLLPRTNAGPAPSAAAAATARPLSPSGWSDLPSDTEDTFFFSPEEIEDYRRNKRRRLIDRGREERIRAILEREGKKDTGDDSDVWGGSNEEPDEAQKELLRRTAAHIASSPNPAQLEMRILANHGADRRFAFLKGRWSRAWRTAKEAARQQYRKEDEAKFSKSELNSQQPKGGSSLQGLVGYGDSDESGDESIDEKLAGQRDASEQQTHQEPESSGEEALKQARRERAREWSARRRVEQCSSEGKG